MRYKDAIMHYAFSKLEKLRFVSEMTQGFKFQAGNAENTSKSSICKVFHTLYFKV